MPPTSGGETGPLLAELYLHPRFVIEDPFIPTGLTPYQIHVLRSTSLAFSLLTLISCAIVLYWFAHMRRSFRHEYDPGPALVSSSMANTGRAA